MLPGLRRVLRHPLVFCLPRTFLQAKGHVRQSAGPAKLQQVTGSRIRRYCHAPWGLEHSHKGKGRLISTASQEFAASNTSVTPLAPGEVHVWWLQADEVRSEELLERYRQLLPKAEQKYVACGANENVRKERLLARTLVRTVLARYCSGSIAPAQLCFESSPNGKPWLASAEACDALTGRLHFNLTHTEALLGVAVTRGRFVGLDAEDSSRLTRSDPARLARRRFSPQEFAALEGVESAAARARLFIRLWTLKEAYVKANGRGISAPPGLSAFTFQLIDHRLAAYDLRHQNQHQQANGATTAKLTEVAADKVLNGSNGSHFLRLPGHDSAEAEKPFRIQFKAPLGDGHTWEVLLMEAWEGHTAALCVESYPEFEINLKMFTIVPLMSEGPVSMGSGQACTVLGYGQSL